MLSHGIPWNMPLVTRIFFVYTMACLKARVYTENTSDAWHIPRYPTRMHCITSINYTILFYTILYYTILYKILSTTQYCTTQIKAIRHNVKHSIVPFMKKLERRSLRLCVQLKQLSYFATIVLILLHRRLFCLSLVI